MTIDYPGLVIPEEVLREALDEGLTALQQNTDLLQRLIKRYDAATQAEILNYLSQKDMRVKLGFARDSFDTPQITVTLESEPDEQFLGSEILVRDRTLPVQAKLVNDLRPIAPADLPVDVAYQNLTGTLPTSGRAIIDEEEITYNGVDTINHTLHVVGRGSNRTAQEFHLAGSGIGFLKREHDRGMHIIGRYRIDILSDNGDVVRWLSQIVKAILIQQYDALSGAGMGQFNINGTDFAPRPDWYPSMLYMRTLLFSARIEVSFPFELLEILSVETYPTVTNMTPEGVIDP